MSSTSTSFLDEHSVSRISKQRPSIFNQNEELKLDQNSEGVVGSIVTNEVEFLTNQTLHLPIFHCDSISSDYENDIFDFDRFITERIDLLCLKDTLSEMTILNDFRMFSKELF